LLFFGITGNSTVTEFLSFLDLKYIAIPAEIRIRINTAIRIIFEVWSFSLLTPGHLSD